MADHPIKALESKAKKLVDEIFKYLPCPVCRVSLGLENKTTTPHHILPKSMYDHLRFIIHNLIPLCNEHHQWAHDNQKQFLSEFLPEFMPHHYKFYVKHRENHKPLRTTPGDLQLIIDDLEYYKQNQMAAENIIYEKG